ncbi:MAG: DUF1559 domain-containing protein [Kiritimatiellia bacterium]|jgi:prepilin-type N-terminal cleavage/methylation domain-containing protein/prepilin-type processing-associated H-X9-DG protein
MTFHRHSSAFTLVELLVVVAIIGLLVASATMGVRMAMENARRAQCASNLRQLFIANTAYASETGHYVPAASTSWSGRDLERWHGYRESLRKPFVGELGPLADYLDAKGIRMCPSCRFHNDHLAPGDNFELGCGGYGYNLVGVGSRLYLDGMTGPAFVEGMPFDGIADPANTAMFADAAYLRPGGKKGRDSLIEYSFIEPYHWVFAPGTESSAVSEPTVHFRHRNHANVVWCDGHVGAVKMENLPAKRYVRARLGWIGPDDNSLMDPY